MPYYKVTMEATTTKTFEVEAASKDAARCTAAEMFSVDMDAEEEDYTEEILDCDRIKEEDEEGE